VTRTSISVACRSRSRSRSRRIERKITPVKANKKRN
jgi:hypothetical protein